MRGRGALRARTTLGLRGAGGGGLTGLAGPVSRLGLPDPMRNPFIAGSWVRGENFFGRGRHPARDPRGRAPLRSGWSGARRLGKTSLLKELEYRVLSRAGRRPSCPSTGTCRAAPTPAAWPRACSAASRTARPSAAPPTSRVEDLEGLSVADMLTTLVRRTVRSGWRLLLLMDEAEEFLTVARSRPGRAAPPAPHLPEGPRGADGHHLHQAPARASTSAPTSPPRPSCRASSRPSTSRPSPPTRRRALLARGPLRRGGGGDRSWSARPATRSCSSSSRAASSRAATSRPPSTRWRPTRWSSNFFSVDFQTLDAEERALLEEVAREGARTRAELARAIGRTRGRRGAAALRPRADGLPGRGRTGATAWATGSSTAGCGGWRWRGRPSEACPWGCGVIVGVNRVFEHEGKQYHIQAEDLGVEQACFEVRVYDRAPCSGASRSPTPRSWPGACPRSSRTTSCAA